MIINIDDIELNFSEARFLTLFAEAFGDLTIKKIEWRDLGYGHQPVAKISAMPVLVGLSWPDAVVTATVIAKKHCNEQRTSVPLPEAHVSTNKWWHTELRFPSQSGGQSQNVVAVLNAAKAVCDECDRCHGKGQSEGSDDYGRPNGEWSECYRCHGRGWLSDKHLWLKEDA